MRVITQSELDQILENHQHYLKHDVPDFIEMRADLSHAILINLSLKNADLRIAGLEGAEFISTDLSEVNFELASLSGAIIYCSTASCANFNGASLIDTEIIETDLSDAGFKNADLDSAMIYRSHAAGAKFNDASLIGTRFIDSSLQGASFEKAKCIRTVFDHVYLHSVDFSKACKIEEASFVNQSEILMAKMATASYIPMVCPEEGEFIGYKKAIGAEGHYGCYVIVTLRIPADAKRSSGLLSRKCRCSKAEVVSIEYLDGTPFTGEYVCSMHTDTFRYKVGETVVTQGDFDECRWKECASGIHFFMNKEEARRYKC